MKGSLSVTLVLAMLSLFASLVASSSGPGMIRANKRSPAPVGDPAAGVHNFHYAGMRAIKRQEQQVAPIAPDAGSPNPAIDTSKLNTFNDNEPSMSGGGAPETFAGGEQNVAASAQPSRERDRRALEEAWEEADPVGRQKRGEEINLVGHMHRVTRGLGDGVIEEIE